MRGGKSDPGESRRRELGIALPRAKRAGGLTQATLAAELKASQAAISKVLRGIHEPRPALARRIEDYLESGNAGETSATRLSALIEAYNKSAGFRRIVDAALMLMNDKE